MTAISEQLIERSGYRREGFPEEYDTFRPTPPPVLVDVLTQLAEVARPAFVVDLGCGTGLSTRAWAGRADEVVGIEANEVMLAEAVRRTRVPSMRYEHAYSSATGLAGGVADIVTCAQSLHWMEPETTFPEIARILRPGGVFAAYDYELPPLVRWRVDAAFQEFLDERRRVRTRLEIVAGANIWPKETHAERMRASGCFRHVRELQLHHAVSGTAADLVGLALSIGPVPGADARAERELEQARARLQEVADRELGEGPSPWYFGYRVRLGIR